VYRDAGVRTWVGRKGLRWKIAARRSRIRAMPESPGEGRTARSRTTQSAPAGEGRASIPGDQAASSG
jgi:hypothetical protein